MKIETKQELEYVMSFYNISRIPIFSRGKNVGEITKDMTYKHSGLYYLKDTEYAFSLAFKQIERVIDLNRRVNKPFEAIDLYCVDKYTCFYPDKKGDEPRYHASPHTIHTETEYVRRGTMDEVFVEHFKADNSLKYCNGSSYKFKDNKVTDLYLLWYELLPKNRRFDLYYSGGIVD